MKIAILAVIIFFNAAVINAAETEINFQISYMDWIERCALAKRDPFVLEFGPLFSVEGGPNFNLTENLFSQFRLKGFAGLIKYEGCHLSDQTPYDTTGIRLGATFEGTLGYKVKIHDDFYLSPFASIGFSMWWREICAETWLNGYFRLGIEAKKGIFIAKAGLLLPFFTEEHGGLRDIPWLNDGREIRFKLSPKGITTPFAEIGLRYKKITCSLSYELRKWEESDRLNIAGGSYIFQPETTQQIFGLKVGVIF
jgi:hypothetical protein